MRKFIVVGILAALAAALLAAPASGRLTIKASQHNITKLGPFHPSRDPTLGAAIHAFGAPTGKNHRNGCLVRWKRLRLHIQFENLSGSGDACSRKGGLAQTVRIGHSRRWRTEKGLRVGNPVHHLKQLYPRATRHGAQYWLKTSAQFGTPFPVLAAITHRARFVTGFTGWIGGAGE